MMAALAGVTKEDDKHIAKKLLKAAGDINKHVEEVGYPRFVVLKALNKCRAPADGDHVVCFPQVLREKGNTKNFVNGRKQRGGNYAQGSNDLACLEHAISGLR